MTRLAAALLALLVASCSRKEPPAPTPLETSTAVRPTTPPRPLAVPGDTALETRHAALTRKIADLTAGGAEVLDRAAYLHEELGDVLVQLSRTDEAIAEYEKAASEYGRTPEGTDMPRIRSEKAQRKADALRGPR